MVADALPIRGTGFYYRRQSLLFAQCYTPSNSLRIKARTCCRDFFDHASFRKEKPAKEIRQQRDGQSVVAVHALISFW